MNIEILLGDTINAVTYSGDKFMDTYSIKNNFYADLKLLENKLYYTRKVDFGCVVARFGFCEDYYEEDIKEPYNYNGKIFILGNGSNISKLLVVGKGWPWWCYQEAYELTFVDGQLTKRIDLSSKMQEISKLIMEQKDFEEKYKNDFNMTKFLKNSINYKDIWWLNNIINNVNTVL